MKLRDMKKTKKFLTGALSLMMVVSVGVLTGCGNSDTDKGGDAKSQTAKEGTLVVGLDDTFAPMGFRDKDNKLVGFDIDLANAVGKELDMKVDFKPISWDAKDMELKSKNIDCIWNGMSVTPEREEAMALSNKYLDNKIILMTLKDSKVKVAKAEDLAKYNIATQADSSALSMLEKNKAYDSYKDKIKKYDDYDKAILDLKAGRVDVVAIDQVLGEYKNKNMKGQLKDCEYSLGSDAYAIGFRKEDTALRDAVNDAIKKVIDNGEAKKISEKWFGKDIVIFEELK